MEIQIGYKELLKISGHSIQQLRRAALTLYGVSEDAARQGGMARKFSLTEGFGVYLMAVLVGDFKMTLAEAKKHVWEFLWSVGKPCPEVDLTDLGFLQPSVGWKLEAPPVWDVFLRIFPGLLPDNEPAYEFRVYKESPKVVSNWGTFRQEKVEMYTSYWLPAAAMADEPRYGLVYELSLVAHLWFYFKSLRSLGF